MIFVIQCAGSKRHEAGSLTRGDGSPVMFVAKPAEMPDHHHPEYVYAHPDDISEMGNHGGAGYWITTETQVPIP